MKKKLEMHLLNDEKLHEVVGGVSLSPCASGDVLWKKCMPLIKDITIVTCSTYEVGCRVGFLYSCDSNKFSSYCSSGFYITPKE